MDREKIKGMFLLAAELRGMHAVDPRKEQGEEILAGLEREYFADLDGAPVPEKKGDEPWRRALQYVGALFASMDGAEDEPMHARQKAVRKEAWQLISEAVLEKYVGGKANPE